MKRSYRNVAFIVELIINVLVFSITCAILVSLFGKASQLARNTREESLATATIHSMFEQMCAQGTEAVGDGFLKDGKLVYYYDKNWNHTETDNTAQYTVSLTVLEGGSGTNSAGELTALAAIAQDKDGREICTMETAVYQPN